MMEQTGKLYIWAQKIGTRRIAHRLAWSIAVLSMTLVMAGLVMSILAMIADNPSVPFTHQFFTPVATFTFGVVGALVVSRHPRNAIGWLFCATGFLSALNMFSVGYAQYDEFVATTNTLPGVAVAQWLNIWVWMLNMILPLTFVLLLFPDGRLLSRRWRAISWAAGLGSAVLLFSAAFHPGPIEDMGITEPNPFGIAGAAEVLEVLMSVSAVILFVGILGSIASVVVRYRRSRGIERAQVKWLAYAGILVIAGMVVGSILVSIWPDSPVAEELSIVISSAAITGIVVATGIAILRYRLWDIDIIINRTLVYMSLSGLIVGMYVVIVGSLGGLFQTSSTLPVSLLATGIVAMLFQPLRERLQRTVNRFMYGERDEPYRVLGRLSERLETVVVSQSVLPTIVETVAEALKLPYAAIALREDRRFVIAAEYVPTPDANGKPGEIEKLPLVYQSETIGQLMLAPRVRGEQFSQKDRHLLETIARQAGVAAFNVRLTQDLQRSREQLVTTREEERRRLRRDLHDGLGPALASTSFKLDAIYNVADHNPAVVKKLVTELKTQMQEALRDIRRIAYDLRPPALDELGLVGALREHIASHNQTQGLQITLEAPESLPLLSAAIEVAAYRIALEAITNISRHARARHGNVRLSLAKDLCLEIKDDGCGLPDAVRAGVGLMSMRERAEELGGICTIDALPQGGTGVIARLPLASEPMGMTE
jgi:signal transduction histidine kinase